MVLAYRILLAESDVRSPIALINLNRPNIILILKHIISDIPHISPTATSIRPVISGGDSRPYLETGAIRRILHRDVENVEVLDDIHLADILAEGTDRDAVRAVALGILDHDGGAVGFEGDAVVGVVDDGFLNDDVGGAEGVEAVGVSGGDGGVGVEGVEVHV